MTITKYFCDICKRQHDKYDLWPLSMSTCCDMNPLRNVGAGGGGDLRADLDMNQVYPKCHKAISERVASFIQVYNEQTEYAWTKHEHNSTTTFPPAPEAQIVLLSQLEQEIVQNTESTEIKTP